MATLELEERLDNLLSTAQTETVDIDLFAPIQEREECPICLLTIPIDPRQVVFMHCCGKQICKGCIYQNTMNTIKNKGRLVPEHEYKCAFCRQQAPNNYIKALRKLMKKNNSEAFRLMAIKYKSGDGVFQSDTRTIEMYIRAAELGDADAYHDIGTHYEQGIVVEQDMLKAMEFWEVAAKKGAIKAHWYLAICHARNDNIQESIKHLKVAANAGDQDSMDKLMIAYKDKLLSKEDLTNTLRSYQASSNEMKSKDRDEANTIPESNRI